MSPPPEEKKDLTSILQLSKVFQESGEAASMPEGMVMEQAPIDKIEAFESLEDYAKTNPPPPEASEPAAPDSASSTSDSFQAGGDPSSAAGTEPTSAPEQPDFSPSNGENPSTDFPQTPDSAFSASEANPENINPEPGSENVQFSPPNEGFEANSTPSTGMEFPETPADSGNLQNDFQTNDFATSPQNNDFPNNDSSLVGSDAPPNPTAESSYQPAFEGGLDSSLENKMSAEAPPPNTSENPSFNPNLSNNSNLASGIESEASSFEANAGAFSTADSQGSPNASQELSSPPEPISAPEHNPSSKAPTPSPSKAPEKPKNPLAQVKKFSESAPIGKPAVPAAYPFSVMIEGILTPEEQEKLLDVIARENMGIRELDLEPQFQSGKILIPRISEFAGNIIIQALRATPAKLKFGPSDSIFATQDTKDEDSPAEGDDSQSSFRVSSDSHPAEDLPITSGNSIPSIEEFAVLDAITATALIPTQYVSAETSSNYQEMLDALKTELKYKAFRRKASGIIFFKLQFTPLSPPTHYRIVASGTAIKAYHQEN